MSVCGSWVAGVERLYVPLRALADRRLAARARRIDKRPKPAHLLTGERGEDAAFFHLRTSGYTVVARRWQSPRLRGDLDLVAWQNDTLVFIEVKTRIPAPGYEQPFLPAEAAVDPVKQRQLRLMAAAYLGQLPAPHRASVPRRFDVMSIYFEPAGPRFQHFPNAFEFDDGSPLGHERAPSTTHIQTTSAGV